MQNKNTNSVLCRLPVLLNQKFVEYLAPTLFMNLSLALTNTANAAIVGRLLGSEALAAVNFCMPVFSIANAVFNTVIIGACTLIVAEKGRMNSQKANQYFTQLAALGTGITLIIPIIVLIFLQPLSVVFTGGVDNPDMRALVVAYLFPLNFAFPFIFISLGGAMILRTEGRPGYGAVVILVANTAILAAAWLLIHVFQMGVAGAAWGTVIGFAFGSLLVLPYFFTKIRTLRFCWLGKQLFRGFGTVLMTGLPGGSTSLLVFARILLLNSLVFRLFDTGGAAAFAVCAGMQYFANMFLLGVTGAMQPISAMLFGEKDTSGLNFLARTTLRTAFPIMIVFAVLFFAVPDWIAGLYGVTGSGRLLLPYALAALALSLPFCTINYFYLVYCQTIQQIALGMTVSFASSFGWIAVLAPVFYWVFPQYFWFILPAAEMMTTLTLLSVLVVMRARSNVSWFLIPNKSCPMLECSVRRDERMLSLLHVQIAQFCQENSFSSTRTQAIDLVVRETIASIMRCSGDDGRRVLFDLIIKTEHDEVFGYFRIAGKIAPSLEVPNAQNETEMDRIRRVVSELRVSQTLGFNVVFFKI